MDILNTINAFVVSIGIPTIIIVAIYIGRKLQILDDLEPIREKFAVIESKVSDLWQDRIAPAHSPRQLNERGRLILEKSGIKEIIDNEKETLLKIVREKGATNPYDAEAIILSVMADLPNHCPDVVEKLKTQAFNSGASMNDVLLAGGIYLRNLIFPDLGFNVEELDKPRT
jgi:hypothetical protein